MTIPEGLMTVGERALVTFVDGLVRMDGVPVTIVDGLVTALDGLVTVRWGCA
ncbi:hypothetical protein ACWDLG_35190 [Nonomuraea sp. NPDC003727]